MSCMHVSRREEANARRLKTGSLLRLRFRPSKHRPPWKTMAGVVGCIAKSRKRNNGRKGKVEAEGKGLVTTRREVVRKGGGWVVKVERVTKGWSREMKSTV